jgi:hypothetical protein
VKELPESDDVEQFELRAGECMDIHPGLVHQMEALEDSELYESRPSISTATRIV